MKELDELMDELKDAVKAHMVHGLKALFNEETETYSNPFLSPDYVRSYLEDEFDAKVDEDFDTNGWDYDYWIYFIKDNKRYMISGSGYYGNLSIRLCK